MGGRRRGLTTLNMKKKLFLSDDPIKEPTEDAFGYKAFVDTLYTCITDCDSKINIGLFGKWGVGKTSIANLLVQKLGGKNGKNKGIVPFLFDAWKYSCGSLRQELVLRLNKEVGVLDQELLEREMYGILEEEAPLVKEPPRVIWRRVWARTKFYAISALLLLGLFMGLHFAGFMTASVYITLLVTFWLPLVLLFFRAVNSALSPPTRTVKALPTKFDPERLEKAFNRIVDQTVGKKTGRLVIIIDNLDRCSGEAAIEMLEAIKCFMEHEKCVYVIPCDYDALLAHLISVRRYEEKDAMEFLRKFFHTSLTIPPLLEQDLEQYANGLLSALSISYTPRVLEVIVAAFLDNPRKMKQFLNNLTTQYLAAQAREEAGILPQGSVTATDGFLAKILVIRQEYPSFYQQLDARKELLERAETYFTKGGNPPTYETYDPERHEIVSKSVFDDSPGLEQFLRSTRTITVDDISPFLKLSRETYPSTIPDSEQFKLEIIRGNVEYFLAALEKLEHESERIEYIGVIAREIDHARQAGNYSWVFNGVDVLTKIYEQIPAGARPEIALKIGAHLTLSQLREQMEKFDHKRVFVVLSDMAPLYRDHILVEYVRLSFDPTISPAIGDELIEQFVEHYDIMPQSAIDVLNELLAEFFTTGWEKAMLTVRKLNQSPHVRQRLIASTSVATVEEIIDTSVTDANKHVVELFLELRDRASAQTKSSFVQKIASIISTNRNHEYDETKQFGLATLLMLDPMDIPDDAVEVLYNTISQFTGLMNRPIQKLEFVKAFLKFYSLFSQQQTEQFLTTHIVPLVNVGDLATLTVTLEEAREHEVPILAHEGVSDAYVQRVQTDAVNHQLIVRVCTEMPRKDRPKAKDVLVRLVNHADPTHYREGLEAFKQLYTAFNREQVGEVCSACLARSQSVAMPEKQLFIDTILETFEKCPVQFKSTFVDHILEFIRDDALAIRNLGIASFKRIENLVDNDKKKEVVTKLLNTIQQKASQNQISDASRPLLDLIVGNEPILERNDSVRLTDTLMEFLSEAKEKEIHLIGLDYLGRIKRLYYRKKMVSSAVQRDLQHQDEDIRQRAKQTLEWLEASGRESTEASS